MRYKVAQYNTYTNDGGSGRVACSYAVGLDSSQFDSIFIVKYRDKEATVDRMLVEKGVKIRSIFSWNPPKSNNIIFKSIRKLIEAVYVPISLAAILRQERVNILHIHAGITYFKHISLCLKGIRIFLTCHTEPKVYFLGKSAGNKSACEKLIKKNGLRLIALHGDMKQELDQLFNVDNTVVIKNGIDFDRFSNVSKSKEQLREIFDIPRDAFVIGHVGRFSPEKNHEFLVKVFFNTLQKNEKAYLLLIGDGKMMPRITALISELGIEGHCKILSNRSDIPELLKMMDVFVFPSKFEGLGIALIEAQVAGLRCIVSDRVPKETFQTKLAVPMSLSSSIDEWSAAVMNRSLRGDLERDIAEYNIKNTLKKLQNLYLDNGC